MADIIWEYIPQEHPKITISDYSQTVQKFATDLLPKLSALEASRSSVESDITSAKNELNSANSGIGSSWTSSTGLKVKDTLSNVIIEGVTRIETSLSGSFKTLLDKLKELSIPIEAINKAIEYTNGLTHKAEGEETVTDSDGKPIDTIEHHEQNDEVQINNNKSLIEKDILAVEETIKKIAAASDGESLGIVGNVSNGGTLGAVTTMDLSKSNTSISSLLDSIIGQTTNSQSETITNNPMETINEFENNFQSYIEHFKSRMDVTGEDNVNRGTIEFFRKEETIEALNETYKCQIALEEARILGNITQEQYLQGCANIQSVYHNAWWGGSTGLDKIKYGLDDGTAIAETVRSGDKLSKSFLDNSYNWYQFSTVEQKEINRLVDSETVDSLLQKAEEASSLYNHKDAIIYCKAAEEKVTLGLVTGEIDYNDSRVTKVKNFTYPIGYGYYIDEVYEELKKYREGCTILNEKEDLVGIQYESHVE